MNNSNIKILLPKILNLRPLEPKEGLSYSKATFMQYHATFGLVHIIMEILYNIGSETFLYFLGPLYKKEETDFDYFIDNCSKNIKNLTGDNINKKDVYFLDLSFRNRFLRNIIEKKKIRGSDLINETYLYANTLITFNILKPIYKIKSEKSLFVKYHTISAISILHVLELYSYICETVYIFKDDKDSILKDSFCVYGHKIDNRKLNEVRDILINKGFVIDKFETKFLKNIFDEYNPCDKNFENSIKNFSHSLTIKMFQIWDKIIKNINHDIENKQRTNIWENIDNYLS